MVLDPARSVDVVNALRSTGQRATADVIALYGVCGGMGQMDNNLWCLWPLSEVAARNSGPNEFGALFGDYLINSWLYRLKPLSADASAVYVDYFDGNDPKQVAPSVERFIEDLWRDPQDVLTR